MTIEKRTLKQNVQNDEMVRLGSVRYRQKHGQSQDQKAGQILTSSDIAKTVIRMKGRTPAAV